MSSAQQFRCHGQCNWTNPRIPWRQLRLRHVVEQGANIHICGLIWVRRKFCDVWSDLLTHTSALYDKHLCRFPGRCAPVALDRYSGDEFEHMSYASSIPRRSPGITPSTAGVARAKARAIYAFQAQTRRWVAVTKASLWSRAIGLLHEQHNVWLNDDLSLMWVRLSNLSIVKYDAGSRIHRWLHV